MPELTPDTVLCASDVHIQRTRAVARISFPAGQQAERRDRVAEAITREHYRRAEQRIEASPEEHGRAFADAALTAIPNEPAAVCAGCLDWSIRKACADLYPITIEPISQADITVAWPDATDALTEDEVVQRWGPKPEAEDPALNAKREGS